MIASQCQDKPNRNYLVPGQAQQKPVGTLHIIRPHLHQQQVLTSGLLPDNDSPRLSLLISH